MDPNKFRAVIKAPASGAPSRRGRGPQAGPCVSPRFDYRMPADPEAENAPFVNHDAVMFRRMLQKFFKGETLQTRVLKGGVVALSGFGAVQGIRLVSNLIMTRLLAPDAFGLIGVTFALQTWIAMMSDIGLNASIMRSKNGTDPEFLATARTMQFLRGLFIASILVVIGLLLPRAVAAGIVPASSVFADERLPTFLFCVAGSVVIAGLSAMRVALHNRALNLAPVVRLEIGAQAIAVVSMVIAALNGLGVYSLAVGGVVAEAGKSVGSYFFLKGPPARFGFTRKHFDEIFGYGKWIVLASTFGNLIQRGDQLLFGWLFDVKEFSFYAIATIWIVAGRTLVEQIQRRIAFPALSELHRERPRDLTRVYGRMRLVYELGCGAMFLGVVLFADLAIGILYPDAYQDVAHYMRLLSVMLLLIPYRLLSSVLLTGGDSKRFTVVTILPGTALFVATPFIFHYWGADAAIAFAVLTPILALPYNLKFASRFIKIYLARESVMAVVAIVAALLLLKFA